jgi:hypothetical protein
MPRWLGTPSPSERFERYVYPEPMTGCWLWIGGRDRDGYGKFSVKRRSVRAHRFSYEQFIGPIPEGLLPDHLCRTRSCVRPDHLELVTEQVNILRGIGWAAQNARKAYCPEGHPYDVANTITFRMRDGFARRCRICQNKKWREYYHQGVLAKSPANRSHRGKQHGETKIGL